MAELSLSKFTSEASITPTDLISEVIRLEGGYVNDPQDRGGETNYGITKTTAIAYKHLWPKYGFTGNMRTLPKALAYDIYYAGYWKKSGCEILYKYSPLLAFQVFDVAVNMGVARSVEFLQTCLNLANRSGTDYPDLKADGGFGPITEKALAAYSARNKKQGIRNLIYAHASQQMMFYFSLATRSPTQEKFINGWMTRVASKLEEYGRLR